jgi:uncharacterized HhH-GPD family protein
MGTMIATLTFTGDEKANRYLSTNPLALLIGLLLDQQVPIERAYAAPYELSRRLFAPLDARTVAALPVREIESCFRRPPALHRYPGIMARRVHALCTHLAVHHDGDPAVLWADAVDARQVYRTVRALPGFSEHTTRVLIALLGKQLGVRPPGWEGLAGIYATPGHRSVADVVDRDSLERVRMYARSHARVGA